MEATYTIERGTTSRQARGEDHEAGSTNVGRRERLVSVLGGGVLAFYGLKRRGALGTAAAAAGSMLIERGVSGHCRVYERMNISTSDGHLHAGDPSVDPETALHVRRAVSLMRSREECYAAWRDFSRLPTFMDYLEKVEVFDETRSRWTAKGPAGSRIEWDAVIVSDSPGRLIAWESVEPSDVPNRGRVEFRDAPQGRGTEVHVSLEWDPPGGRLAKLASMAFGKDPQHEVNNALRRFRQIMETGTIPTVEGQSTGRGRGETIERLQ